MTEPTFAHLLAEAMARAGLSQNKLADRADVDPSFISRIRTGDRHPSRGMVKQLADALGLGPGDPIRSALLVSAGYADERGPRPMTNPLAYDLDDALRSADEATRLWLLDSVTLLLAGYRARIGRSRIIALKGTERTEETA
jgi:transcriptional regulator with XRE-family HTH domain